MLVKRQTRESHQVHKDNNTKGNIKNESSQSISVTVSVSLSLTLSLSHAHTHTHLAAGKRCIVQRSIARVVDGIHIYPLLEERRALALQRPQQISTR